MTVRLVRTPESRASPAPPVSTRSTWTGAFQLSLEACAAICMATLEAGIAPFVRVPANTPDHIARVLEGGALGIIAPHVHSAAVAQEVVRAATFPPLGERSNVSGLPHLHFRSFPQAEAYAALNAATMIIVQLERRRGTRARRRDRRGRRRRHGAGWPQRPAGRLGHSRRVRSSARARTYAATIAACRKRGKHCGVGGLATRPDLVAEFVKMGARYVSTGTDLGFLMGASTARAKAVREIKL